MKKFLVFFILFILISTAYAADTSDPVKKGDPKSTFQAWNWKGRTLRFPVSWTSENVKENWEDVRKREVKFVWGKDVYAKLQGEEAIIYDSRASANVKETKVPAQYLRSVNGITELTSQGYKTKTQEKVFKEDGSYTYNDKGELLSYQGDYGTFNGNVFVDRNGRSYNEVVYENEIFSNKGGFKLDTDPEQGQPIYSRPAGFGEKGNRIAVYKDREVVYDDNGQLLLTRYNSIEGLRNIEGYNMDSYTEYRNNYGDILWHDYSGEKYYTDQYFFEKGKSEGYDKVASQYGLPDDYFYIDEEKETLRGDALRDKLWKVENGKAVEVSDARQLDERYNSLGTNFNSRFWQGDSTFAVIGSILGKYRSYYEVSSLVFGEEELARWRESIDRAFAQLYLGTDYWASAICESEIAHGAEGEGFGVISTPSAGNQIVGHVEGERSEAIPKICSTAEECGQGNMCYSGICRVNRCTENITTENGTTMLEESCAGQQIDEYFYKITYSVTAPGQEFSEKEGFSLKYNLEIYGDETYQHYSELQEVQAGETKSATGNSAIVKYSSNVYDKVCIIFDEEFMADGKTLKEICNYIAVSDYSYINWQSSSDSPSVEKEGSNDW